MTRSQSSTLPSEGAAEMPMWAAQEHERRNLKERLLAAEAENAGLKEALEMVARAHHATVTPSKLHHPEEVRFDRCQAKTCRRAHAALATTPDGERVRSLSDDHAAFGQGRQHSAGLSWHDEFARCPDCGNATVGLSPPYGINHAESCTAALALTQTEKRDERGGESA